MTNLLGEASDHELAMAILAEDFAGHASGQDIWLVFKERNPERAALISDRNGAQVMRRELERRDVDGVPLAMSIGGEIKQLELFSIENFEEAGRTHLRQIQNSSAAFDRLSDRCFEVHGRKLDRQRLEAEVAAELEEADA